MHRLRTNAQVAGLAHPERVGQIGVHLGDGDTEPVRLAGEVAACLVRVQVGLGHQIADAGLGQLPPVGRGGHELLQHRDRIGLAVALDVSRAEQLRDVARTVFGQRDADLDVGIDAWLQAPEHLQDRDVAVHERGVRLLAGEHEAGLIGRAARPGPRSGGSADGPRRARCGSSRPTRR